MARIEDYAMIGDCRTAAIIDRTGSIDWFCVPRFDSPACFAALLGTPDNGRWLLGAAGKAKSTRAYVGESLVLETTVTTATGKIGQQYTVQGNGYGKGFEDLGFLVTHFLLYALPRDGELPDAKPVLFRYNRQVALDALQNVHNMIDAAEVIGWDSVIADQQPASFCFDCRRYESHDDRSFIAAIQGK